MYAWNFMMHLDPYAWELDALGVSLGARPLQVRNCINCGHDKVSDSATLHPVAFASSSQSSTEWHYSSIEWEAFGILYGLAKFHHYCFAKEVCIITDHKAFIQ